MADSGSVAFDPGLAVAEIQAAQVEIAEAADAILFATETSLSRLAAYRAGDATGLVEVERALCAILGACAFQDLSGQRLSKIEGWPSGTAFRRDADGGVARRRSPPPNRRLGDRA